MTILTGVGGGVCKFLDTRKGGSEKIVGLAGGGGAVKISSFARWVRVPSIMPGSTNFLRFYSITLKLSTKKEFVIL